MLHCETMYLGLNTRHGVFDKDQLIASIMGSTCSGFDTEVGGHSTQDDGTDSSPAELLIEFRTVKGAPVPLGDQQVAGLISALGNNLRSDGMNPLYADAKAAEREEIVREFKLLLTSYLSARLHA
jgi:hypothetical protein